MSQRFSFYEATGTGYERGWYTNFKGRYRAYVGARNTKKSYDMIGLEVLQKIITDPRRNVLIIRQVASTNKDSTFATLCKLIDEPMEGFSFHEYFSINKTTLEIRYLPTGQTIQFKGMLKPEKVTSIRVVHGYLTDVYVEEAFELKDYNDWRKVDGSIRGKLPKGLFHQITFCMNAWNQDHWIYEHFFKGRLEDNQELLEAEGFQEWCDPNFVLDYGVGLYLHKSTYKINEFRDKLIYDTAMEELKRVAPEIYKVEALGMWGNALEGTYPEFSDNLVISRQEANNKDYACFSIGIDTGYGNGDSATTAELVGITQDYKELVAVGEYFHSNSTSKIKKTGPIFMQEIVEKIIYWKTIYYQLQIGTILVYVDCADVGFRDGIKLEARKQGLYNVRFLASTKMKISNRVAFSRVIMAYGDYKFSEDCPDLIREIKSSRKGENGVVRADGNDHAINAHEYGWAPIIRLIKRWKTFKER